jgi:hypothetical protein
MSDVNNPLCGQRGATAIFGPQKGVRRERIAELDTRLARFAALAERAVGRQASALPGAGAAGGLGFALLLIGGELRSGAQVVADLTGLDAALTGADWLITGEGKSDLQTLLGKTPWVVAQRAAGKRSRQRCYRAASMAPLCRTSRGTSRAALRYPSVRSTWPTASPTLRRCSPIAPSRSRDCSTPHTNTKVYVNGRRPFTSVFPRPRQRRMG